MCTYCFFADHIHKWYPWEPRPMSPIAPVQPWPNAPLQPWQPWPNPTGPAPVTLPVSPYPSPLTPITPYPHPRPWTREQFDETMELIRQIKEMEDALGGCPCEEPSKLDFLKEIQDRLDALEAAQKGSANDETAEDTTSGPHPITE